MGMVPWHKQLVAFFCLSAFISENWNVEGRSPRGRLRSLLWTSNDADNAFYDNESKPRTRLTASGPTEVPIGSSSATLLTSAERGELLAGSEQRAAKLQKQVACPL